MENLKFFNKWLKRLPLGWLPIAISLQRQIFMLIDLRNKKGKYLYVMADSREEVMEWLMSPKNVNLHKISCDNNKTLKWFDTENSKRGKIRESFEIVRLLENELPDSPFPILDARDRGTFKILTKTPRLQKNRKDNKNNIIVKFSDSTAISPTINQFLNDWNWDYNLAVFQMGVFFKEFERMYLIRCLYRRKNLVKKFLGWKVQLIREIEDTENFEHPFWNVSIKEEKNLGNLLNKLGFFSGKKSCGINTPEVERKRRFEFQKKVIFL